MTAGDAAPLLPLLQLAALVAAAPLFSAVLERLGALLADPRARLRVAPYARLRKLLAKREVRPYGSSRVHDLAPALALAATVSAAALVPALSTRVALAATGGAIAFTGLLALARFAAGVGAPDSGNPLAVVALARERLIGALAEPALLVALLALALAAGTIELGEMAGRGVRLAAGPFAPGRLIGLAALALAVLAEPWPRGSRWAASELAAAAPDLEYGGPRLALLELGQQIRRLALFVLAVNLAAPWGLAAGDAGDAPGLALALLALVAKLLVAAAAAATIESGLMRGARLRTPAIQAMALALAFLSLLLVVLGGEVGP